MAQAVTTNKNIVDKSDNKTRRIMEFGEIEASLALFAHMIENGIIPFNPIGVFESGLKQGLKSISFIKSRKLIELFVASALNYAHENGIDLVGGKEIELPKDIKFDRNTTVVFGDYFEFIKANYTCWDISIEDQTFVPRMDCVLMDKFVKLHLHCVQAALKLEQQNPGILNMQLQKKLAPIELNSSNEGINKALETLLNGVLPTVNPILSNFIVSEGFDPLTDVVNASGSVNVSITDINYAVALGNVSGLSNLEISNFSNVSVGGASSGPIEASLSVSVALKQGTQLTARATGGVSADVFGTPINLNLSATATTTSVTGSVNGILNGSLTISPSQASIDTIKLDGLNLDLGDVKVQVSDLGQFNFAVDTIVNILLPLFKDYLVQELLVPRLTDALNNAIQSVLPLSL